MFKPNDNLTINEQHDEILNHLEMAITIRRNAAAGMSRKHITTAIARRLNEMGYSVSQAKVGHLVKQVLG